MFKKNKLSHAVFAALLTTTTATPALAQERVVEEVVVTGIRASLQRALDVKRDSAGVVDAIVAEDIGKFPDTNLAESLQRIPGVSIDRSAGEGNSVTVRGFGPTYNMVTVNGRQMPSSNAGRAFNFNDLSAELVNGVEVNKTSSAHKPSGGIGATINISTARPLEIGEFRAAGSLKAVTDSDEGSITPEISGLVSNTFADDTIGVLFALSHQQRKYELERVAVDGWRVNQNFASIQNPEVNQTPNTFMPQNYNISLQETERTRTNANLVFQYAPNEDVVVTADYMYSQLQVDGKSSQLGVWFNAGSSSNVRINENGTVIDMYEEGTFDNIQNWFENVSENQSIGLNVDWNVSENLNVIFDANFAKSERNPGGEFNQYQGIIGYGNQQRFQIIDGAELPVLTDIAWDPARGRQQAPFCGNPNWTTQGQANCLAYAEANGIDPDSRATGPTEAGGIAQELLRAHRNDIQHENTIDELNQFRLEGKWTEDNIVVRAGLMYTDQSKNNRVKYNAHEPSNIVEQFGGFYGYPVISPETVARRTTIGSGFLSQFSGRENLPREWVYFNPDDYFADIWPAMGEGYSQIPTEWSPSSYDIQEKTLSSYVQLNFDTEVNRMPLHIESGVRLESTETTSSGFEQTLIGLTFTDPTSLRPDYAPGGSTYSSISRKYNVVLPNLSAKLEITNDLVARFAAGRSITRPNIGDLQSTRVIGDTRPQGAMTARGGNPGLKPYSANNIDVGLEWYYGELSFVSAGYFWKSIDDFIVGGTRRDSINGVTDPSSRGGTQANPTPPAQAELAIFDISSPINGPNARVEGFEFAAQHEFGQTGFGVSANVTFVTTNRPLVKEDVNNRFAIAGLSDSANLIAFYEGGPFQARIAYNWRDSFLRGFDQLQGGDAVVVTDYGQWDFSASYDITDNFTVLFEGINVTGEGYRSHGRYEEQLYEALSTGPRFALGVRARY